jgi:hypothetical protein
MVQHVILLKWKPEATSEQIEAVIEGLLALKDKIPGILEVRAGEDFSGRNQGYTHGAVFLLKDRAALEAYFPHPMHRKLVDELIQPIRDNSLGFDFDVPD